MSTHEFSISVTDLDAGGKDAAFVVRPAWVRGALEGCEATTQGADGSITVRVSKSDADVIVAGTLDVPLTIPCARCLEPVDFRVSKPIAAIAVLPKKVAPAGSDYEFTAEEADMIPYDGENVVLDDLVRDELVLETPMYPLCSEDCPGIAAPLGSSETVSQPEADTVDPRLAPLLRLKASLKKE
jgi:uncharacterized protein